MYPNGRRSPFIARLGVFFVAVNILPPGSGPKVDAYGRDMVDNRVVVAGSKAGFTRQGAKR